MEKMENFGLELLVWLKTWVFGAYTAFMFRAYIYVVVLTVGINNGILVDYTMFVAFVGLFWVVSPVYTSAVASLEWAKYEGK